MTSLIAMEPNAVECAQLLVKKFAEFAEKGMPINLQVWLQYFAFDTIALITVHCNIFSPPDEGATDLLLCSLARDSAFSTRARTTAG